MQIETAILAPAAVLAGWTMIVFLWLLARRLPAFAAAGVPFPGHTEMLAHYAHANVAMMLANEDIRTVLTSIHVPLKDAVKLVTRANVLRAIRLAHHGATQPGSHLSCQHHHASLPRQWRWQSAVTARREPRRGDATRVGATSSLTSTIAPAGGRRVNQRAAGMPGGRAGGGAAGGRRRGRARRRGRRRRRQRRRRCWR